MDSGSTGSMQSSSGGDEEYDSRPPDSSFPTFLGPSGHFGSLSNTQQSSPLFDPSPNIFGAFSHSPPNPNPNSSLLNLDMIGPGFLGSDPVNKIRVSSSSLTTTQSMLGVQGSNPSLVSYDKGARSSQSSEHIVSRNPKKRTRASRRAPTTVLSTDTSNFRAMVQEFTGIPAPPFSGSPYSRRFDLFRTGSSLRSGHHLETMGSFYPLPPSLQKVHQQSPPVPSSSSSFLSHNMVSATNVGSAIPDNNTTIATNILATAGSSNPNSINYHPSSDLGGLSKQPQYLMLSIQNQMFPYQSLLQTQSLHPSLNVNSSATLSAEELGLREGHVHSELGGLFPGHDTTEGRRLRDHDNSWKDGLGSDDGSQDHLRLFDGQSNYNNSQRVNSCKFNYSASSSGLQHDKGLENVSDSWICPSE
ncbi:hypothetical protein K2173_026791 [Erythroxylum novogranatense]|uniref:VQ domain-containing protein n=1 Tax=Erythroxylum novogranatense TaxID=1862640 RepID=A0AAV8U0F1_9ROSI|nr:hypothetical protein K2173_026791 [Erythroxylum novogranatense]